MARADGNQTGSDSFDSASHRSHLGFLKYSRSCPMRHRIRILLALAIGADSLAGQQYTPANKLPNGREIVAVYFGANSCGPCHSPAVKDAVRKMKDLLSAEAQKSGAAFSVVGVANDWDQTVATKF